MRQNINTRKGGSKKRCVGVGSSQPPFGTPSLPLRAQLTRAGNGPGRGSRGVQSFPLGGGGIRGGKGGGGLWEGSPPPPGDPDLLEAPKAPNKLFGLK